MQVFSKEWFDKYQKTLCWLANNRWTKRWFRYVLRIHSFDCPLNVNINRIELNAFWFGAIKKGELIEVKADFRTNTKFARRLYHAFKPMWWAFHAWDWLVADRWIPALSFNFSTLTQYPGSIGADNPCDGYLERGGITENWATITAGAGTSNSNGAVRIYIHASFTTNVWDTLHRGEFLFDTSALTSSATISATVLSLFGVSKVDGLGITPDSDIYTSNPSSTSALTNSDFQNVGTTSQTGSPLAYSSFSTVAYNDYTFNATGIGNVSKTGISKFGWRNANYDVSGTPPSWSSSAGALLYANSASAAGTTNDPKLVVTYTLPAAGGAFLYLMV